jgi:hypothetical protein
MHPMRVGVAAISLSRRAYIKRQLRRYCKGSPWSRWPWSGWVQSQRTVTAAVTVSAPPRAVHTSFATVNGKAISMHAQKVQAECAAIWCAAIRKPSKLCPRLQAAIVHLRVSVQPHVRQSTTLTRVPQSA